MKKISILLLTILLFTLPKLALAIPATVVASMEWTQVEPTSGPVDGWILSYGQDQSANGSLMTFERPNVSNAAGKWHVTRSFPIDADPGTEALWFFKLRAYKGDDQSEWSTIVSHVIVVPEVSVTIPSPGNLVINITINLTSP